MEKKPTDGIAERYDEFYSESENVFGAGKPEAFVLKGAALMPQNGMVIELGAGQGRNALALARQGFQVQAVDLSRTGVDSMNRLAEKEALSNFKAEIGDARKGLSGEYDLVISTFMLHHFEKKDAMAFIQNIQAHTKKGGLNAVAVFTNEGDFSKTDDVHFYPALGEMKDLYADWEVLSYNEEPSRAKTTHSDGTPMVNIKAEILARKPHS